MSRHTQPGNNSHHLYYPRTAYQKHTVPYLLRQHPVNQIETEVFRHNALHHTVGALAVMSVDLAKATFDSYDRILHGFTPNNHERIYRLGYLARTIELYEVFKRGRGALPREAGYFADVLQMQMPYLLPEEK